MRLLSFRVDRFGVLAGQEAGELSPGVNVFLGANEAGKSTLLDFFRAMFFGYQRGGRNKLDYGAEDAPAGGKAGGSLVLDTRMYGPLALSRTPGKGGGAAILTTERGEPLPGASLEALLGNCTPEMYDAVFAFSLGELTALDGKRNEKIRHALYGAAFGTGLETPGRVLERLQAEMTAIYAPRARNAVMIRLLRRLRENQEEQKRQGSEILLYAEQRAGLEALRAEEEASARERARLETERGSLEKRLAVSRHWEAFARADALYRSLPEPGGEFTPDGLERLERLEERLEDRRLRAAAALRAVNALREELERLRPDPRLAAAYDPLQRMQREDRETMRRAGREVPALRAEALRLDRDIASRCADLGPGWDGRKAASFTLSLAVRETCISLGDALTGAAGKVARAGEEVRRLEQELLLAEEAVREAKERAAAPDMLALEEEFLEGVARLLVRAEEALEELPGLEAAREKKLEELEAAFADLRRHAPPELPGCAILGSGPSPGESGHALALLAAYEEALENVAPPAGPEELAGREAALRTFERAVETYQAAEAERAACAERLREDEAAERQRREEARSGLTGFVYGGKGAAVGLALFLLGLLCLAGTRYALLTDSLPFFSTALSTADSGSGSAFSLNPSAPTGGLNWWEAAGTVSLTLGGLLLAICLYSRVDDRRRRPSPLGDGRLLTRAEAREAERSLHRRALETAAQAAARAWIALEALMPPDCRCSCREETSPAVFSDAPQRRPQKGAGAGGDPAAEEHAARSALAGAVRARLESDLSMRRALFFFRQKLGPAGLLAEALADQEERRDRAFRRIRECLDAALDHETFSRLLPEEIAATRGSRPDRNAGRSLAAVRRALQEAGQDLREALLRRETLAHKEEEQARISRALHLARAAVETALAEHDLRREAWRQWLAEGGFEQSLSPETARLALDALKEIRAALENGETLARREAALRLEAAEAARRLAAIAADLGEPEAVVAALAFPQEDDPEAFADHCQSLVRGLDSRAGSAAEAWRQDLQCRKKAEDMPRAESERLEAETLAQAAEEEKAALLGRAGTADSETFRRDFSAWRAREEARLERERRVAALAAEIGRPLQEADLLALAASYAGQGREDIERSLLAVQQLLDQAVEREKDIARQKGELGASLRNLEQGDTMAGLRREEEALREELREQGLAWSRLALARSLLLQAKAKFEKERLPGVVRRAETFFTAITGGAYAGISLSLDDNSLRALTASGQARNPEDELSRGTKEQLYLALRLAYAAEHSRQAEPLPVIMDDILVNFDARRAALTAKTLHEYAAEQQVLFFTCHEATARLLARIVGNAALFTISSGRIKRGLSAL